MPSDKRGTFSRCGKEYSFEELTFLKFSVQEILSKMTDVIKEINDMMSTQLNLELMDWKRRQQIACIGGPVLTGMDQLQNWYSQTSTYLHNVKATCVTLTHYTGFLGCKFREQKY